MNTTRQQRRAAEREAAKAAFRQSRLQPSEAAEPEPISPRQAINRQNAQLSTGPRTPEGKAISSRNSFKHGLYSSRLVLDCEDPAELDALRSDFFAEHQPATETESLLVNEIADQYWRLRRCRKLEVFYLNKDFTASVMNTVQRMMASAERGMYKALTALTKMQKARGFVPAKPEPAGLGPRKSDIVGFVPAEKAVAATAANPQPADTGSVPAKTASVVCPEALDDQKYWDALELEDAKLGL